MIALNTSFEQLVNFGKNWEFFDNNGKKATLQTIISEIVVNGEKVDVKVFIDGPPDILTGLESAGGKGQEKTKSFRFVEEVSRRGSRASPRQA